MSYRLNANADQLSRTTNPSGDHTVAFWTRRRGTGGGSFEALSWMGANTGSLNNSESLYYDVPNTQLQIYAGDDAAARVDANFTFTTDAWVFVAYTAGGAVGSNIELFTGSLTALVASLATGTRGANGALGADYHLLGDTPFTGEWWNGNYAHVHVYDSILTLEQLRVLQLDSMPRVGRPWAWQPAWDETTAGLADWSGNARAFTAAGTITAEDNPPIVFGGVVRNLHFAAPAAGGVTITPPVGALDLAGLAPLVSQGQIILPAAAGLALTGSAPQVSVLFQQITPPVGALLFTGELPQLSQIFPASGELTLSGHTPLVIDLQTRVPASAALALNGFTPVLAQPFLITPPAGALTLTGATPLTLSFIAPGGASLTLQGFVAPQTLTVPSPAEGVLTISGFAPVLNLPFSIVPATAALALNGSAPTVRVFSLVIPNVGALLLAGSAPQITDQLKLVSGAGAIAISGEIPLVTTQSMRAPAEGSLTLSGFPPGLVLVSGDHFRQPEAGVLIFGGRRPTVLNSGVPLIAEGVSEDGVSAEGVEQDAAESGVSRDGVSA